MSKLVAVVSLFLSSLFIVTNATASLFDLNNDEDFRNSNLLISYGGGGGGGNSPKDKAKKKTKNTYSICKRSERYLKKWPPIGGLIVSKL